MVGGHGGAEARGARRRDGEPTPLQPIETRAIHPRTFHIHPSERMLVAQHNLPVDVRGGDAVRTLPAGLSVFRIGDRTDQPRAVDSFRATAARTSAFNAAPLILSPSWKSMARRVLPSRLALKRCAGSSRAAPLAKVIFRTLL